MNWVWHQQESVHNKFYSNVCIWKLKLNKCKLYSNYLCQWTDEWGGGGTKCEFHIGQYLKWLITKKLS